MNILRLLSAQAITISLTILSAKGALLTVSNTAPTVNGGDLANIVTSTGSDQFWTDRSNPGQSFTTGSGFQSRGYELTSFSFQLASTRLPASATTMRYTTRVVSLSGTSTSTTVIETNQTWNGVHNAGDWLTITFDAPIVLASNTQYGFDIEHTSGGAWQSGITSIRRSGNTLAGGSAYRKGDGGNSAGADGDPSTITLNNNDRIFHANLITIVPEPSTTALIGLGGLALILRRRK